MLILSTLLALAAPVQTQAKMTRTATTAFTRADAEMTRQWKATYAAMKRRDAADTSRGGGFGYAIATLESQRAWLKFRDAQCVIEGGEFAGGSMQPMAMATCRTRLTQARTKQLQEMVWKR